MPRQPIPTLVLLAIVVAACSATDGDSPSARASAGPSPSASAGPSTSEVERRQLPDGFPILPGAMAIALPADDPALIALWETDQLGSAAYDFYVAALPAGGYPIVGLYPGGEVALIRFTAEGGEVWQMVAHGTAGGRVRIEIRPDRP